MKLREEIKSLSNDLQEAAQDKGKSINIENTDFQADLFLLNQEYQKKQKELALWVQAERNKLVIRHNQKINNIKIK
jgi:hypothetical protein